MTKNVRGNSGTNRPKNEGARGFATAPGVSGYDASVPGANGFVTAPGVRGFATSTQNTDAANELYSGPKSRMVPVHDSMAGYNGVPVPVDNIQDMARQRGYEATPISDDDLDPQKTRARFS